MAEAKRSGTSVGVASNTFRVRFSPRARAPVNWAWRGWNTSAISCQWLSQDARADRSRSKRRIRSSARDMG